MAIDRIFEALASRPRREILAYLSAQELAAGEIASRFQMSAPAISRHLSVLESAGLVQGMRKGQFVMYRLCRENLVNTLTGFAFEICPVAGPLKREARTAKKRAARKQPQDP
jgi:DNA-binding transcriptional ArsR family regulator